MNTYTDLMINYTNQRHAELVAEAETVRMLRKATTIREPLRHRLAISLHHLADLVDARPRTLAR